MFTRALSSGDVVEVPTVRRGRLPGSNPDNVSMEWYGRRGDRDIPERSFQFPLDVTYKDAFFHFHPDHFNIVFFGLPDEWPRASRRSAMLELAGGEPQRSILVAESSHLGELYATVLRTVVIDAGGIILPKLFLDLPALERRGRAFPEPRGNLFVGRYYDFPASGMECTCGLRRTNDFDEYVCC